jgi:hypothetical protein
MKKIETLKKDELFMLKSTNKVTETNIFSFDGYCRQTKKYCGTRYSDFCDQKYLKKGTLVFTDFEF